MDLVSDFIATEARFGAQNYEPLGVVLSRGEGVWVWDTQGNRYLDYLSAYSAVNQGHCHPKILAAMVMLEEMPSAPTTRSYRPLVIQFELRTDPHDLNVKYRNFGVGHATDGFAKHSRIRGQRGKVAAGHGRCNPDTDRLVIKLLGQHQCVGRRHRR
jgi:hypothetical protein